MSWGARRYVVCLGGLGGTLCVSGELGGSQLWNNERGGGLAI